MIRLGIIGMSPGNGHPYSWSAICNGYDVAEMMRCSFPIIPAYLGQQDWPNARLKGVEVTHVWTQERELSDHIARASFIPHVVDKPEEMLGNIDALLLARDDAENHIFFAEPFLRAGLPVYVDKPVAIDLKAFDALYALQVRPNQIFTCSALRFAHELRLTAEDIARLGKLRLITGKTPKYWNTYAIHLIDPILRMPGVEGSPTRLFVAPVCGDGLTVGLRFETGRLDVILTTLGSKCIGEIEFCLHGENGWHRLSFHDSFTAFKGALSAFIAHCQGEGQTHCAHALDRLAVEIVQMGRT
jgi:predicted dehydrogenase